MFFIIYLGPIYFTVSYTYSPSHPCIVKKKSIHSKSHFSDWMITCQLLASTLVDFGFAASAGNKLWWCILIPFHWNLHNFFSNLGWRSLPVRSDHIDQPYFSLHINEPQTTMTVTCCPFTSVLSLDHIWKKLTTENGGNSMRTSFWRCHNLAI